MVRKTWVSPAGLSANNGKGRTIPQICGNDTSLQKTDSFKHTKCNKDVRDVAAL